MVRILIDARRVVVVAFFLLFIAFPVSSASAEDMLAGIQQATLANGMEVVVVPDPGSPVVTHMVWYKTGAADEAPGESGLAHFLEHLMFRGTEKIAPNEFSVIIARHGGVQNAETTHDYTAYYQRVARDLLPRVMEMEADRMANLLLRPEEVLPEREVVKEERRQRVDNDPSSRFAEQMSAAFYLSHPYSSPVVGWMHEIESLSQESARAFYDKYYAPNNAILVVAGDVTLDEVRSLAEQYYGPIPAKSGIPPRVRPQEPPHQAAIRIAMTDPLVTLTIVVRRYLVPSLATNMHDAVALQVLADLLGTNMTSRFYKTLVVERGLATAAGVAGGVGSMDSGELTVYGVLAPGVDVATFEGAMDGILSDLLANGVSDAEVEKSTRTLAASAIMAGDDQEGLARIVGQTLVTGGTLEDVKSWAAQIRAVTRERVEDVARRYLRIEASVTGVLSPAPVSN